MYIPPRVGNIFKFMVFTFLKNTLNLGIFTDSPVPHPTFLAEFYENRFPPTAEKSEENYYLLYQNSTRKYEDDLEH